MPLPRIFFLDFLHGIVHFGAFLRIIFKFEDLLLGNTTNAAKNQLDRLAQSF